MIENGNVRRTIHIALKDIGYKRPYPLEGGVDNTERSASLKRADNRVQEFVWAFGAAAETEMEKQIMRQIEHLKETKNVEELLLSLRHILQAAATENGTAGTGTSDDIQGEIKDTGKDDAENGTNQGEGKEDTGKDDGKGDTGKDDGKGDTGKEDTGKRCV